MRRSYQTYQKCKKLKRVANKEEVFFLYSRMSTPFFHSQPKSFWHLPTNVKLWVRFFYCHDLLSWPVFRHFYLLLWVSGRKKNCTSVSASVNHNFYFFFLRFCEALKKYYRKTSGDCLWAKTVCNHSGGIYCADFTCRKLIEQTKEGCERPNQFFLGAVNEKQLNEKRSVWRQKSIQLVRSTCLALYRKTSPI